MSETQSIRGHRRQFIGKVISNSMNKTIRVRVQRRVRHSRFKKVITQYRTFFAHDDKESVKIGDTVRIQETRPLSKLKHWRLVEVLHQNVDEVAAK